ncbi:MAG: ABC transporter substrate-binding protein [Chloroflexota bacterium]
MASARTVGRRRFIRTAFVLSSGAALLAACQQASPAAPKAETKPAEPPKPAAAAAATSAPAAAAPAPAQQSAPAAVKRGGSITLAQELDPVTLDPHKSSNFSAAQAFEHVYESLTRYDDKLNVQPSLAERWEISPDGKQYTFFLRKDVKWHDGKEFTANDVRYWHERMMAKETVAPFKNWFDSIEKMEVVDKNTVRAVLANPYPPLLASFAAMRGAAIIPEGAGEKLNLATQAIGTGPWKLSEFVPQSHIKYVRNPDYWEKDIPVLDELVMKIVPEEDARVAALRAGQVDYAFLSKDGADRLRSDKNLTILETPKAWLAAGQINSSRKPFDDKRVRQALRYALDTEELIQKATSGAAKPSGPIPTGHTDWFLKPEELRYAKPDLAKAKALLAEAGATNLKFTILCSPQYPEFVSIALVMQDTYKKLGINAEVEQIEWGNFTKRSAAPTFDYDISITAFTFFPDPDSYTYPYYHSKGTRNPTNSPGAQYKNPKVDELLDKGRQVNDKAQRLTIYNELQKLLEEESPFFWFYAGLNIEAVRSNVKGYVPSFTGRRPSLRTTSVEK